MISFVENFEKIANSCIKRSYLTLFGRTLLSASICCYHHLVLGNTDKMKMHIASHGSQSVCKNGTHYRERQKSHFLGLKALSCRNKAWKSEETPQLNTYRKNCNHFVQSVCQHDYSHVIVSFQSIALMQFCKGISSNVQIVCLVITARFRPTRTMIRLSHVRC